MFCSSRFTFPFFVLHLAPPVTSVSLSRFLPHICTIAIYSEGVELWGGGGGSQGIWLMRSPCRATVAADRGDGSSCARCKATAGSSHSSPPQTGTGCGASAVAGKALSRSWGRWCSPWRWRWTWAALGVPECSRCRTRRYCRGWWEGQSGGRCRAGSWKRETAEWEQKTFFFLLLSLGVERSKVTCVLHAWKAEQQLQLVEKESNAPMRHSRRTELQRQDADWAVGPQWQGVFKGVKNIGPTVKHSGSSGNHEGGQHLHLLCTVLKRRAWKPTNLPRIVAEYQPELCQMLVNGHQTHLIKC